jgi:hypothetical protein
MKRSFNLPRIVIIAGVAVIVAGIIGWWQGLFQQFGLYRPKNSLMIIVPCCM